MEVYNAPLLLEKNPGVNLDNLYTFSFLPSVVKLHFLNQIFKSNSRHERRTKWQETVAGSSPERDLLLLYLSRLGQNRHGHGAGVDAALLLGPRHSLHSVHPSFKLHVFVGFWASNAGGRMPKAALETGSTGSFLPFCHALFKLTTTCVLMK